MNGMTRRRAIVDLLTVEPRSVSSLARAMGLTRGDVEDDLRHALRTARAAGHAIVIEPACCKSCGFVFGEERLAKPGKCPSCHGTRLFEAQIRIEPIARANGES
jgi:predicted Zn-ribbon and HTH transcriptional regulator